MSVKTLAVATGLLLAGCGLGPALEEAGRGHTFYEACISKELAAYRAKRGSGDSTTGAETAHVIAACKETEDAYVVSMTDLALVLTGDLVSRAEFLENEDANLREDLHERAAEIVEDAP